MMKENIFPPCSFSHKSICCFPQVVLLRTFYEGDFLVALLIKEDFADTLSEA